MSVVVLMVGLLVAGAGVVAIGFGIPINTLSLGQTLIIAGATTLAGGLVLIGLAACVRQLTRIAEALKARPAVPRPAQTKPKAEPAALDTPVIAPRSVEPRLPEPAPPAPVAAASTVEVSASAIERLRSSIARPDKVVPEAEEVPLSPNGGSHAPERASEPRHTEPVARANPAAVETKEPRLDFLFRSKPAPRPAPPESFDALWPRRQQRGAPAHPMSEEPARPARAPIERSVAAEAPPPAHEDRYAPEPAPVAAPPPPAEEPRSIAILKSGVVDGMAYTLYADGSIEAQLPHGTVRFGSIAELRAHIENNG